LRDASLSAPKFQDFHEERAAPERRGGAPAQQADRDPFRAPKKKPSVLARVFAPHRMGVLLLLGIGGLAFVGVPMNALFLQDGHHPAPLFTGRAPAPQEARLDDTPPAPARRVQPDPIRAEPDAARSEIVKPEAEAPVRAPKIGKADAAALKAAILKSEAAPAAVKPEKKHEVAARDPIAAMIGGQPAAKPQAHTQAQPQAHAQPHGAPQAQTQAQAQAPSQSVASVQRALQRLGYVVKPDGVMGGGTRQAIEKFERDNGLPAKGELTAKIAKLLANRAAPPRQ
jgi:hypothetical protein